MKKSLSDNIFFQLFFLSIFVFISRLPFLWAGFGAEEDSWLLALTAKNMALSGNYEMSRAPGHPLQEYLYAFLYNNGLNAFYTNLISALASVIATVFFSLSLRQLNFKHYLFAGFAFAFTPVVYISSTYTIDYMLAMAFVMASMYYIFKATYPTNNDINVKGDGKNILTAGILLGIAIGFRLTSAAMLLPFCIILYFQIQVDAKKIKNIALISLATLSAGLLCYLPALKTNGLDFFHYSDQFPYPNFSKILYKMTIGVFGTIGIVSFIVFKTVAVAQSKLLQGKFIPDNMPVNLFWACMAAMALYLISYFRLPQKSGYLIPFVPIAILMYGYYLSGKSFKILCVLFTMSSFFFSINLTDSNRGAAYSALAMKINIANQEIFIDPLTGPIISDYSKRLNKIKFTEKVFQKTQLENKKTILICGWWYNELLVRNWNAKQNPNVIPVFYINKPTLNDYLKQEFDIYYLPEQNLYNDQFSQMSYTDSIAKPYI